MGMIASRWIAKIVAISRILGIAGEIVAPAGTSPFSSSLPN
jgi:hypothetical protein